MGSEWLPPIHLVRVDTNNNPSPVSKRTCTWAQSDLLFSRINLDLCVEKEALKQEIEEKNKLLEDAYIALESIEKEKDRDREFFEAQIQKLSQDTDVK